MRIRRKLPLFAREIASCHRRWVRFNADLLTGRQLYETVIRDGLLRAKRSVWIATANVKEMFVERPGAVNKGYQSIVAALADLHDRKVELRLLHADLPSRRFRAAFD